MRRPAFENEVSPTARPHGTETTSPGYSTKLGYDRRAFLFRVPALAVAAQQALSLSGDSRQAFAWGLTAEDEPAGPSAAEVIAGKDARLIVHGANPAEIETPLALLREHRVTPKSLLFVRNNQSIEGAMHLDRMAAGNWKVELVGLVNRPATITVERLAAMEQTTREIVLQCSGNGRAIFSKAAPAEGAPWECGAMGNVVFAGVPLRDVLRQAGVEPAAGARFVTAEGRDRPARTGQPDFEHSIPLDDALSRAILALSLNGEPIPAVHGGPVRLIVPGYYATMSVKWLSRLRFDADETDNHHQVHRYRTPKEPIPPGSEFRYAKDNSDPNWRMRTKSVIFAPLDGERVRAGRVAMRGVAFNDGSAPIETVLVTTDPDQGWRPARVVAAESPFAWQHWSTQIDLPAGEHVLRARAIDALGRSQPLSPGANWNPAGYAFHGVHAVRVIAE